MKASGGRPLGGGACLSRISGLLLSNKSIRQIGTLSSGEIPERLHFFIYRSARNRSGGRPLNGGACLSRITGLLLSNKSTRQKGALSSGETPGVHEKKAGSFLKYECNYSASRWVSSDPLAGLFLLSGNPTLDRAPVCPN